MFRADGGGLGGENWGAPPNNVTADGCSLGGRKFGRAVRPCARRRAAASSGRVGVAPNFTEDGGSLGGLQRHIALGDAGGLSVFYDLIIRPATWLLGLPLGRQQPHHRSTTTTRSTTAESVVALPSPKTTTGDLLALLAESNNDDNDG